MTVNNNNDSKVDEKKLVRATPKILEDEIATHTFEVYA